MRQKCEIICIICPLACKIKVISDGENIVKITGYQCKKGKKYTIEEFTCPMRVLTATIRTKYSDHPLIAVRTDKPIPKKLLRKCMYLLANKRIDYPVKFGEVIIQNILNTGADLIATQDLVEG